MVGVLIIDFFVLQQKQWRKIKRFWEYICVITAHKWFPRVVVVVVAVQSGER